LRSLITRNETETVALGKRLGELLMPGDFIALVGELGTGKTRFVQGIAAGLSVDPGLPVTSPTYSLLHIHRGRLPLFHFDLYRLKGAGDLEDLGFEEYFYGEGVSVVEWADRLEEKMPDGRLVITFSHLSEEERNIEFTPKGERYQELVVSLLQ
jgi:tRNA threonylcarbamoyladenosine biosynthesis protein TsaE